MTLRIAICGPNPEINNSLAVHVQDLLFAENPFFVPNPVADMLAMVRKHTIEDFSASDIDWMNLWSASLRRVYLMGAENESVVVAGSTGIDQLVIQASWLSEQMTSSQGLTVVDARGNPILTNQVAMINRSGAVVQVLLNSAEEEITEYWDFVYAVVPVAVDFNTAPTNLIAHYLDFLDNTPAFAHVTRLPDNEAAARDALGSDVERWKAKLAS